VGLLASKCPSERFRATPKEEVGRQARCIIAQPGVPPAPLDDPRPVAQRAQGPAARCANVAVELARLKGAIMKTLVGALTVGAILIGASSLSWAADVRHMRQPKHDDPERLRMIRECMDMHGKHRGDMPFHSGGNERLYHACMANRGHHG
jgi:hypothetical protein